MLNKTQKTFELKLCKLFGATISTRQAVTLIVEKIPSSANRVVVDFLKIDFISRSFAHAFLQLQKNSNYEVLIMNASKDVLHIFDIVKASMKKNHDERTEEEITESSIHLSESSFGF